MPETFTFKVEKSVTLNEILRKELPRFLSREISNSKIRRLIVAGSVCVNGKQVRVPAFEVWKNSEIQVSVDEKKLFFEKQNGDISFELTQKDVLFEDESIIVVNKPAHFPTEAGMVDSRDNLHAAVVRYLFEKQRIEKPNVKNPPYVGIMHRLDRDTSGVILFTKTRAVNVACHDMFEKHTAQKVYHAIVCAQGLPPSKKFSVEFLIGRISPKSQAAKWGKVSEKEGGLFSKTEFKILKEIPARELNLKSGKFFLVECCPLTGRTHQIRVHLASQGLPILGDVLYGGESYERVMLHAFSLTFPHPISKEMLTIGANVDSNPL